MMSNSDTSGSRIDKFLWSTRIYKSRSIAAEACRNGRILVNDQPAKSSRAVNPGDIITARKMPVIYTFRVIGIPSSRVGAPLVSNYIENLTPQEELDKLAVKPGFNTGHRLRGTGRPTKKERRSIDRYRNESDA